MEIKGTIYRIDETQTIGAKGFRKREFIVRYAENPEYPEYRKLELIQDKCELIDSFKVSQEITCQVNPKGRLWTDPQGVEKCFNTDQVWKITGEASSYQADKEHSAMTGDEPNDLPF